MVVSGALSLGLTYHAMLLLPLWPGSLFLSSLFLFLLASRPSWLNPRLSYFTVKIVEYSFRLRGLPFVQFHAKKMLSVEARPGSWVYPLIFFSNFLGEPRGDVSRMARCKRRGFQERQT